MNRISVRCAPSILSTLLLALLAVSGVGTAPTLGAEQAASQPAQENFVPADESPAPLPPLSPEESLAAWEVRDGYRVELVAAEPLTMDPVAIDWGADGRLWVVEMADYPDGLDGEGKPGGRVRILEDTNGDGRYDKAALLLEGLNFPTGIVTWKKGAIVTAAPEILYIEDSNGDGTCDVKQVLFSGFFEGNQQLRMNGLRWGLDGWLHCASGSHVVSYGSKTQIKSHLTGKSLALGSRDFRFDPATGEIEPLSGPSQFGRNVDAWGNWFGVQNSYPLWHYVLEERYLRRNPHLHAPDPRSVLSGPNPRVYPASSIEARFHSHNQAGRFTSACSGMVYRDSLLFPAGDASHAFTCEPVHNLVQHNLLTKDGPSFQMERDASGDQLDFLASRDRWCRPVMTRTGPDGALWVVDMYRYVIEHPHWLPKEGKEAVAPYLRAGDGRGRIYRVVPDEGKVRSTTNLAQRSPGELVALLDHPNGWLRDKARELLREKKSPETVAAVREMLQSIQAPPGRLSALAMLHQWEACDEAVLMRGLADPVPEVRRFSLRLAETVAQPSPALWAKIAPLADDPDAAVRLQLGCCLGEWKSAEAAKLLARMLQDNVSTAPIRIALLSSLNATNVADVADAVATMPLEQESVRDVYREVMRMALAFKKTGPLTDALAHASPEPQSLARAMICLDLAENVRPESQTARATVMRQARATLTSADSPEWLKLLAVRLLFQQPEMLAGDLQLAEDSLGPTVSLNLRKALIRRLGEQNSPECCDVLLQGWSSYSPDMRTLVLEQIVSQPKWHPRLIAALDEGLLSVGDLDLSVRQQLVQQKGNPLAAKFQQRFAVSTTAPGAVELPSMQGASAARGLQVFEKHCSSCHRVDEQGKHLGPNLQSLTNLTAARLYEAVVAPNNAVDAKYQTYIVATADGRVISGMITNESDHSLTLQPATGDSVSLLREEIDELQATGKSLMPEGFAQAIPPQQMADLLAYVLERNGSSNPGQ